MFSYMGSYDSITNPLTLFLRVCSISLLKTLREKEKLLGTSNFSFSHSVFHPFGELSAIFIKFEIVVCQPFQFGPVRNMVVWEKIDSLPPTSRYLTTLKVMAFENIAGKSRKCCKTGFSSFPPMFSTF